MKLLVCFDCESIFSLSFKLKTCDCGKVKGRYDTNGRTAVVNGEGVSMALGSGEIRDTALKVSQGTEQGLDRKSWQQYGKLHYAWMRPHDGPGNPHTTVDPEVK